MSLNLVDLANVALQKDSKIYTIAEELLSISSNNKCRNTLDLRFLEVSKSVLGKSFRLGIQYGQCNVCMKVNNKRTLFLNPVHLHHQSKSSKHKINYVEIQIELY